MRKEQKASIFNILFPLGVIFSWWIIEIADQLFDLNMPQYGMHPRSWEGLWNIFTYPFIHRDWTHLISNSIAGALLFFLLFLHHKKALRILMVLYIVSGLLLWCIAAENTLHIGASGVIYAVAFFLILSGFFRRDRASIAVALLVIIWNEGLIWGLLPVNPSVSWQGHLSGAISGILLASILYLFNGIHQSPKRDTEESDYFFENNPFPEYSETSNQDNE